MGAIRIHGEDAKALRVEAIGDEENSDGSRALRDHLPGYDAEDTERGAGDARENEFTTRNRMDKSHGDQSPFQGLRRFDNAERCDARCGDGPLWRDHPHQHLSVVGDIGSGVENGQFVAGDLLRDLPLAISKPYQGTEKEERVRERGKPVPEQVFPPHVRDLVGQNGPQSGAIRFREHGGGKDDGRAECAKNVRPVVRTCQIQCDRASDAELSAQALIVRTEDRIRGIVQWCDLCAKASGAPFPRDAVPTTIPPSNHKSISALRGVRDVRMTTASAGRAVSFPGICGRCDVAGWGDAWIGAT